MAEKSSNPTNYTYQQLEFNKKNVETGKWYWRVIRFM